MGRTTRDSWPRGDCGWLSFSASDPSRSLPKSTADWGGDIRSGSNRTINGDGKLGRAGLDAASFSLTKKSPSLFPFDLATVKIPRNLGWATLQSSRAQGPHGAPSNSPRLEVASSTTDKPAKPKRKLMPEKPGHMLLAPPPESQSGNTHRKNSQVGKGAGGSGAGRIPQAGGDRPSSPVVGRQVKRAGSPPACPWALKADTSQGQGPHANSTNTRSWREGPRLSSGQRKGFPPLWCGAKRPEG